MEVLLLTVTLSLLLALLFLTLFLADQGRRRKRVRSLQADALLPLDEDPPKSSPSTTARPGDSSSPR